MSSAGCNGAGGHKPTLSVVVSTYNRVRLLDLCLASLTRQDLDASRYEVIVVNNNCTDGTAELAGRYCSRYANFRTVIESNQGHSHCKNRGCREARGTHVVYLDDDAYVDPPYLSNMMKVIRQHDPDILGGPVYPFYTDRKPHWFKDEYEIREYARTSGFSTTCRVSGGNFIIKKALLEKLGMHDVNLGMAGDLIRLGEEAKVLDGYRRTTPLDKQKVYYSLDVYIRHWVPKYKMKIGYVIRRGVAVGRMKGKQIGVMQGVPGRLSPLGCLRDMVRLLKEAALGVWRKGPFGVDWIVLLRKLLVNFGMILEAVGTRDREPRP